MIQKLNKARSLKVIDSLIGPQRVRQVQVQGNVDKLV
jgi:hypothetical protein